MSKVQVHTAQNVSIDYKIASIGDRILATIVDGLIIFGFYAAILLVFTLVDSSGRFTTGFVTLLLIPIIFYHLVCEIALDGQTFGKKAIGTKVVKLDGTNPSIGSYLLRWLLRFVEVTMSYGGIALITIVANGKGQRLGDIAAGTCVIKLPPKGFIGETIFRAVEERHQVMYPEVVKLTDEDVSIIHDVIRAFSEVGRNLEIQRLAEKTQRIVVEKMGVQTTQAPVTFLRRVLQDYNHAAGRLPDEPIG